MKNIFLGLVAISLTATAFFVSPSSVDAATRVKSYYNKSGTFVQSHFRSNSNFSKFDNYSTKGNINPYTGKNGTVNPFKITPKKYSL